VLLTAAAVVIVLAGMKAAEEVMVPLVFAAFIAVLTAPSVLWLEAKGLPGWLAVGVAMLAMLLVFGLLATILGGSLNAFVASVPGYQDLVNQRLGRYLHVLDRYGFPISEASFRRLVNPAQAMDIAGRLVSQITTMLSDTLLIVFTLVFMLFEVAGFPKKIRRALGDPAADLSRYSSLTTELKRYVVVKTYVSVATGLVLGIFLSIQGVDYAVLWGVLAFLLNYIPNIGSIVAAVPPTLLALVQFGAGGALITGSAFVVVNMVIGNVIEPRLLGRKLGLSTLVVWLSLIFWGWLWGPMGMLLSVPLTIIVKILLENTEQFRPVALLMDQPPMSARLSLSPLSGDDDPTRTPRL
jgi:predicted PurR-regulated permease PerM